MKYFITDMDGTLLDNQVLSEENIAAIKKLQTNGFEVILASGRSDLRIELYKDEIPVNTIIASNGGMVKNCKTNEYTHLATFDFSVVERMAKIATNFGVPLAIFTEYGDFIYNLGDVPARVGSTLIDDLSQIKGTPVKATIVLLDFVDLYEAIDVEVKKIENVTVVHPGEPYIDVSALNVSKWSGALTFLKEGDFTIAIGDGENDLEMIKNADFGIAMDKSRKQIKDVANLVVKDVEHGGFVQAVEYVLDNF